MNLELPLRLHASNLNREQKSRTRAFFVGSTPTSLNRLLNHGPHSFRDSHLTAPLLQTFPPSKIWTRTSYFETAQNFKIIHLICDKLLTFGEHVMNSIMAMTMTAHLSVGCA